VTLSERETAIIQLLAAGHTDAATAAQLGLSVRTVAYTLRGLMDRYQVQNRFQLGLVLGAVAAEYVPDPDLGEEQPS
jgi:DNA-binding CsgD family transcriptional regulator